MNQDQALEILKKGHNVFLTGAPGAGKTFLLNKFIKHLRGTPKVVAITASTGIAATHMNGVTIHSWSGLGIKETITDQEIKGLMKRRYLFKRLRKTDVLIIDEVSMLKPSQFDAVDKICRHFRASFLPFGGMQVVLSGDFFQLPPIERNGEEVNFITESGAWRDLDVKICYLQGQFRHKDEKLVLLLECIRDNNVDASRDILATYQGPKISEFATKLYTHNVDVDEINNRELGKIQEKEFTHPMTSRGKREVVATLKRSCLASESLALKRGAQVMFIKNNFDQGYVNGTQGTVIDFDIMGMPIIRTIDGQKIAATKASWKIENEEGKTIAEITQLPLRLAWAITVHKSQGMNLDAAQIDLSKCFVKGMGYVALSRLKSLAGLHLLGANDMAFYVDEKAIAMDAQFKDESTRALKLLEV